MEVILESEEQMGQNKQKRSAKRPRPNGLPVPSPAAVAARTGRLLAEGEHEWLKRLRRHRDELLTFLDEPEVPFDNNLAERAIRPAVMIRKNSFGNRSDRGADTQAVLMSVYRTLQQRGHAPLKTVVDALTTYRKTGKLPPLPAEVTAVG